MYEFCNNSYLHLSGAKLFQIQPLELPTIGQRVCLESNSFTRWNYGIPAAMDSLRRKVWSFQLGKKHGPEFKWSPSVWSLYNRMITTSTVVFCLFFTNKFVSLMQQCLIMINSFKFWLDWIKGHHFEANCKNKNPRLELFWNNLSNWITLIYFQNLKILI